MYLASLPFRNGKKIIKIDILIHQESRSMAGKKRENDFSK